MTGSVLGRDTGITFMLHARCRARAAPKLHTPHPGQPTSENALTQSSNNRTYRSAPATITSPSSLKSQPHPPCLASCRFLDRVPDPPGVHQSWHFKLL